MFGLFTKTKSITMTELQNKINNKDKFNLIDVREKHEYKNGHIPTAKNIPMMRLLSDASSNLKQDQTYFIVCQSGARSRNTVKQLTKMGYNVVNVSGGTMSYPGRLDR